MIKTVFFDLGNVLVFFSHHKMFQQMADCTGLSEEAIRKILLDEEIQMYYETGQIDSIHFCQIFQSRSPNTFDLSPFLHAVSDIFTPNTALYPLIEQLKNQGIRLILLSNTSECHFAKVSAHYPILKLFDDQVLSYEVGALKPSEKIFRKAVSKAECELKHCFYTDDIHEFVQGARKIGLDSELFTNVPALKSALTLRGVTIDLA